jgi:predicted acylesterase/phospholipase RssA/CRP-like cAMP-binding protein
MGDSGGEHPVSLAQRSGAAALLASSPLFDGLSALFIERLEPELESVRLPGGATLFREGDRGDCFYIVVNGRLRVTTVGLDGRDRVVNDVGRGEVVGDMAMLTGEPRSATVRAIRDTELLRCSRAGFDRLIEHQPEILRELAGQIVRRLERAIHDVRASKAIATVAVVPAGAGAARSGFSAQLTGALAGYGKTKRLDPVEVDRALGAGTAQSPCDEAGPSRLVAWLTEQELHNEIVVYEAEPAPSNWNSRCLRQADRVLIAATVGETPVASLVSQAARMQAGEPARCELVLVHAADCIRPSATAEWLESWPLGAHHHVRRDSAADHRRLARALTGRSVGVVLGGGGARGFAHIGVLRALDEAGIPVDHIGGASMGALIAAQRALGWDHDAMLRRNREAWVHARPLSDYTVPVVSLIRGRKVLAMLEAMFGTTPIEDLWLPYFCVSSNLTRAEVAVHRHGPLARWVAASMSVPGIGPPLSEKGDLFVDGGVLNNLPADVMRTLCAGPLIAVDVSPRVDPSLQQPRHVLNEWLWRLINPMADRATVPNILNILLRTASLGIVHTADVVRQQVDLYINPPVEEFGMFDWKAIDRLVEIGYRYAQQRISEWQRVSG